MRRLLIPAAIVAIIVVARAFLATEGRTPPGQPALEHLTSADALKGHFNRDPSETRVLMLLAPSCSYCLKGATVIERILRDRPSQPLNVLVVWQPMLSTDWGRPGTGSLGRLSDSRVRQFWDAEHTVARAQGLVRGTRGHPRMLHHRRHLVGSHRRLSTGGSLERSVPRAASSRRNG